MYILIEENYIYNIREKNKKIIPSFIDSFNRSNVKTFLLDNVLSKILLSRDGMLWAEMFIKEILTNKDFNLETFSLFLSGTNFFRENRDLVEKCYLDVLSNAIHSNNRDLINKFAGEDVKKCYDPDKQYGPDGDTLCHTAVKLSLNPIVLYDIIVKIGTNPFRKNYEGQFPEDLVIEDIERYKSIFDHARCIMEKKVKPILEISDGKFPEFLKRWDIFVKCFSDMDGVSIEPNNPNRPSVGSRGASESLKEPLPPLLDQSQNLDDATKKLDKETEQTQQHKR